LFCAVIPGYVQGGQEAKCGYLLLGIYYRRIPGDIVGNNTLSKSSIDDIVYNIGEECIVYLSNETILCQKAAMMILFTILVNRTVKLGFLNFIFFVILIIECTCYSNKGPSNYPHLWSHFLKYPLEKVRIERPFLCSLKGQ
jgi:hypothetical protein